MGERRGSSSSRLFVGRARELDELRGALAGASLGRGALILVSGEPGIGKTRLAEEIAGEARAQGALVVWGRCWEGDGAPAFWPWVQVLRSLAGSVAAHELPAHLGAGAAHVAGIVPELGERLSLVRPARAAQDSEDVRFQQFDAVTTFLSRVATEQPMLVLLDDLHWADRSSLLLLEFVARQLRDSRILVVGAYREAEVRRDASAAGELVGGVTRVGRSLPLRGLSAAEVGLLMERTSGRTPDARLVAAVHRSTDGNPFFVDEIVRLLAAEGIGELGADQRLPIPEGLRAALRQRVARLPSEVREALAIGSVVGREFDLVAVARASRCSTDELLGTLERACDAGLLTRLPHRIGAYGFTHAVIRETVYDDIAPHERMRHHGRIGEALEELHAGDVDARVAELAFHFFQAAIGDADQALDYAMRAGEQALRLLAYEEAVAHYERALQLGERRQAAPECRCDILLRLGDALWSAGESARSRDFFVQAAEIARVHRIPDLLARAALGLGMRAETGLVDDALVGYLETALAALTDRDAVLRAKVTARLAMALYFSPSAEERRNELSLQAVAMAERLGDRGTLAFALLARLFVLWGPGSVEERLSLADAVIRLARQADDVGVVLQGLTWKILSLLELGDVPAVDREIDAYERESAKIRVPHNLWYLSLVRSARAFLVGDFAAGERLAATAAAVRGESGQHANALVFHGAQLFTLRREQGRLAELGPALTGFATRFAALPIWRCSVALYHCEQGDHATGRRQLDELAARDFAVLLPDGNRPPALALLAEACSMLGEARHADVLYRLLLPFASRNIVVATSAICYGPASRYLGLLATTLGRYDDASRHFADAAALSERMGARPWAAHTQRDLAVMLRARDGPGDRERASELLAAALATARDLGMKLLETKVLAATEGSEPAAADPYPPALASAAATPSRFRRDGGHWLIAHDGVVFRLKDSKGLRTIAHLLRNPGRERHVAELAVLAGNGGDGFERPEPGALAADGLCAGGLGDAGRLLDPRAKAAYRARLEDLRGELEEAVRRNDTGRAENARREIDFLTEELSRAVGLGGRDRRAAAATERARLNVTRAIRAALDKLADFSPPLHAHLSASLRTGTYCSYQPQPRDAVVWSLDP